MYTVTVHVKKSTKPMQKEVVFFLTTDEFDRMIEYLTRIQPTAQALKSHG